MSPTRDFNFVTDTCQGFIDIASRGGLPGEAVNIGSGGEISINDLTHLILEIMNREDIEITCQEERIRPEKVRSTVFWQTQLKFKSYVTINPKSL